MLGTPWRPPVPSFQTSQGTGRSPEIVIVVVVVVVVIIVVVIALVIIIILPIVLGNHIPTTGVCVCAPSSQCWR